MTSGSFSLRRAFIAALALGAAALVQAAKPPVYCADASPEGFDPALWDSAGTSNVTAQIFQGLLAFRRGTGTLVPALATAWTVTPDARTFTFTLRRGADEFLTPNLTCAASRGGIKFCNKDFDTLVEAARAEVDEGKRLKLFERAQLIFKHERPWIPMAHSAVYIPLRKDVQGFVMAPNGGVDFEGVFRP